MVFARVVLAVSVSLVIGPLRPVSGTDDDPAYESPVDVQVTEPRLTPRAEPLRDFPVEQILDVTDFGAVPNDDENDAAGIRAAMKKATEAKIPTEVRFPKGRYYLDADIETDEYAKVTNDALALARAEQVILNGNGSEIIIRIHNSARISVQGNHIQDRRPLVPGAILVTEDCQAVDVRGNTLQHTE